MRHNHFFVALLGAILVLMVFPHHLPAGEQGWINNSLNLKINHRFNLKFTREVRCREVTFSEGLVHNWQGGIVWVTGPRTYLGGFYKRQSSDTEDFILNENRFTLEAAGSCLFQKKPLLTCVCARKYGNSGTTWRKITCGSACVCGSLLKSESAVWH